MPNGRTAAAPAARLSRALIATLLVLLAELVVVAIASWEHFAGLWEVSQGTLRLLPTLLALGAFAALARAALAADKGEMFWARAGAAAGLAGLAVQSIWEVSLTMPANAVCAALMTMASSDAPAGGVPTGVYDS